MKPLKTLCLAATATVLAALIGSGIASATALTSPEGTVLKTGSSIHAVNSGTSTLTTSFKNIECKESTIQGKTTNESGTTITANVETLTFGSCNCEVKVLKGGTLSVEWTSGSNGTVRSSGTEVTTSCSTIFGTVHCIYVTSSTALGTLTGGNPAKVDISSADVPRLSTSFLCDETANWGATYEITSPKPLYVDGSGGGGATSTSLSTSLSGEAKSGEEITINEGSKAKDTATLSGTNASKATGKVKFRVYKDKECKELAAEAGEGSLSEGKASSEEKTLEAGRVYYWQAEYPGDSNNLKSTSTCGKEILTIKASTSLATSLSGEAKSGEEITINEGSKAKDTATLSGTNASKATGKVKFRVYKDKECKELAAEAGEGSLSEGKANSEEKTLEAGALYYWQAEYPGDALHQASTSTCGKEVLTVKAKTSLSTTLSGEGHSGAEVNVEEEAPVYDTASLGGTNAAKAGGAVEYFVYEDEECKELATSAGKVSVSGSTVPASNEEALPDGIYYWQAVYSGDSTHEGSTSVCGSEIEVVAAETSITTSLSAEGESGPEIIVGEGASVTDAATLTGANAAEAGGTAEYRVYQDEECKELATEAGNIEVSEGSIPESIPIELPPGTYYWQATYFGDLSNQSSDSVCGSEVETVEPAPLTTMLSGEGQSGAQIEIVESAGATDSATINEENSPTAGGTIEFFVYEDEECEQLATSAGKVSVIGGVAPPSSEVVLPDGTYYWQAHYSGDLSHPEATSACGSEIEVVAENTSIATSLVGEGKSGPEIKTKEGSFVSDTASLSGPNASKASGIVEYRIYEDSKCENLAEQAGSVEVSSGVVPPSEELALSAGTYYWRAQYYGDGVNQGGISSCGGEVLHVTVASLTNELSGGGEKGSEIETEAEVPVTDRALLNEENAATATGKVKYAVYHDSQCEEWVSNAGEVTVSEGKIPVSNEEILSEGTYYWQAEYSGDGSHEAATSECSKAVENVSLPWVVSVGDSYVSGEGGRWAGNVRENEERLKIDAFGPGAYRRSDNLETFEEAIPKCHRSVSAEIFFQFSMNPINPRVKARNFACSAAKVKSQSYGTVFLFGQLVTTGEFKPGLDFADASFGQEINPGKGRCPLPVCEGQAKQLEDFAKERKEKDEKIKMVVVSIGGNNFGFGEVVRACRAAFKSFFESLCSTNPEVQAHFTKTAAEDREKEIEAAIERVGLAMERAGFEKLEYTIVVQDYPSPIPEEASEFRYPDHPLRETLGGCPFHNADAHWANAVALRTMNETVKHAANAVDPGGFGKYDIQIMDIENAFNGRRLCENGLTLVGAGPKPKFPNWLAKGAVDETEWMNQVRIPTWEFQLQEDLHPNYWAQLALRNCLRQVYNNGSPLGAKCTIKEKGLTKPPAWGAPGGWEREPIMKLTY